MSSHTDYVQSLGVKARHAAQALATLNDDAKSSALRSIAGSLRDAHPRLLDANAADIDAAREAGLASALVERLKLSEKKIDAMASSVEQIAAQMDPVGQIIEGYVRPNGLRIQKVRCPLGVVLFFYESRPNVTSDAAALCLKSGNAVILRGGKEAIHSNRAIVQAISGALQSSIGAEIPALNDAVQFIDNADRALIPPLLKLDKYIDLVIPRGGESLIRTVVAESTIPVLKHFTGNCHLYIDAATIGMDDEVVALCVNSKTSYPGGAVCNAVEHILFHREAAARLLPKVAAALAAKGVEIRADAASTSLYPAAKAATDADWDTEYLAFIVGIKIVQSLDEAVDHINLHGSHHTDGIISSDARAIDRFTRTVDSASLMVNASTRFADGGEYGLGAEIGISTDKLHARGPMGAADLTIYKWIVTGDGHTRA